MSNKAANIAPYAEQSVFCLTVLLHIGQYGKDKHTKELKVKIAYGIIVLCLVVLSYTYFQSLISEPVAVGHASPVSVEAYPQKYLLQQSFDSQSANFESCIVQFNRCFTGCDDLQGDCSVCERNAVVCLVSVDTDFYREESEREMDTGSEAGMTGKGMDSGPHRNDG